mmetsp:Transcript_6861/g.7567  ORF Transcript_6861/g.7567 Transcript_6861/m.7567 type:complete len:180 (-) Transcript_6861:201-740(-)
MNRGGEYNAIFEDDVFSSTVAKRYQDRCQSSWQSKDRIDSLSDKNSIKKVINIFRSRKPQQNTKAHKQRPNSNNTFKKKRLERATVEIFPGFKQPLRLALETENAIRNGFVKDTNCLTCSLTIHCIRDAKYVLCPVCRNLSPLGIDNDPLLSDNTFGVGLGFVKTERSIQPNRLGPSAA